MNMELCSSYDRVPVEFRVELLLEPLILFESSVDIAASHVIIFSSQLCKRHWILFLNNPLRYDIGIQASYK